MSNEKCGSSSTAGSTVRAELLPILQLFLGSVAIDDGDCDRREMRAGERYKLSTDMEVDHDAWRIVNEGDVGEDRV